MSSFYPQVFNEMSYSHAEVFADTLSRAENTGADITVLPEWYDVDRPPEIALLQKDLEAHPDRAPRTRELLSDLSARYPRRLGAGAPNEDGTRGGR
jgi:hypothetical protein